MRFLAAALLLAAAPAAPARAQAPRPPAAPPAPRPRSGPDDATAQAKAHFRRGTELYRQARYREAIAEFQETYRLRPHGVIHFNLAQCHERLGDIPAALQSYHEYLRAVPDAEDRKTVLAAIANLEARLGASGVQQLLVYSDPAGAEVLVDGLSRGRTPLALVLPHGSHSVSLLKPGYRTTTRQAVLSPQVSVEMDVALQKLDAGSVPLPPPPAGATAGPVGPGSDGERGRGARAATGAGAPAGPEAERRGVAAGQAGAGGALRGGEVARAPTSATAPPPRPPTGPRPRVWTWVAAGAAAVVLGTAVYYGASARSAERRLMDGAPDTTTADRWKSQAQSRARTANVLYGVGGACAAGAGALFFVEGSF